MTFLTIVGIIIGVVILVYVLSRIATRGALTEIEEFFKSKKDGNPKD
jgi:ABC-type antimicrobial peptide transport system permease subunit